MLKVNQLAVVASVIKSMVKALDDPIIIEDQKEEVSEWKHMTMKYPISCQMMKGLSHDAENLDGHNYVAEKLWDPGGLRASRISSGGECHGMAAICAAIRQWASGPMGQTGRAVCAEHKEGAENRAIEQNRDFRRWSSSSFVSSLNPFLCLLFPLLYL
jgi:hypothetical protein